MLAEKGTHDKLTAQVAAAGARLTVGFPVWLRWVLARETLAITLGSRVFLSSSLLSRSQWEIERIVEHELEHVRQVARDGLLRFAWRYAREYLVNRRRGMSAFEAYEAISFEVEARVAENRLTHAKQNGEDVRIA